jgi:hypothetical protein
MHKRKTGPRQPGFVFYKPLLEQFVLSLLSLLKFRWLLLTRIHAAQASHQGENGAGSNGRLKTESEHAESAHYWWLNCLRKSYVSMH